MKQIAKRIITVTTIALVITNGATAALAEDASSPSTTVPTSASVPKTVSGERSAYRTAVQNYNKARIAINKTFIDAVRSANETRRAAIQAATEKGARKAAQAAFSAALNAAQDARTSAFAALGNPPSKPTTSVPTTSVPTSN